MYLTHREAKQPETLESEQRKFYCKAIQGDRLPWWLSALKNLSAIQEIKGFDSEPGRCHRKE